MQRYSTNILGRRLVILTLFLLAAIATAADARVRQLHYAGATTLEQHFMPEATKLFKNRTGIEFSITGGNTGPGIQALIEGTVDIAGAGRFLKPSEKAQGLAEHQIGWDALYVIVHRDNPIDTLSRRQLRDIMSGKTTNWLAVGGPDLAIMVVTTPPGSGIRTSIRKLILHPANITSQEVISPITKDADRLVDQFPTAITVLSASMVDTGSIKVLDVDGIAPTPHNITDGHYPLIKPLTLITEKNPTADVANFIALAESTEGQRIIAEKFFPVRSIPDRSGTEEHSKVQRR